MRGRAKSQILIFMLIAAILTGTIVLQYSIDSASPQGSVQGNTPGDIGRSILDLLGGVRETVAAYFWTKTDEIFHEYLGGTFLLEKPLFPYYWMITRLDPHFIMAYYFASWVLCRFGKVKEGFDLGLEGLRNNPNSATLQENLASLYIFFKKDPKKARYHILKAIALEPHEEQKQVYMRFLSTIDLVLAGKRKIPKATLDYETMRILKEAEEHEHGHEHGHEHNHEH